MINTIPRYFSSFSKFILFLFILLPSQVGAREYNYETDESISSKGLIDFNKKEKVSHLICVKGEPKFGMGSVLDRPEEYFYSTKDGTIYFYANQVDKDGTYISPKPDGNYREPTKILRKMNNQFSLKIPSRQGEDPIAIGTFNSYIKGENLIINEKTILPGIDQPPLLYKYKINLKTFQVSAYDISNQKTYQSYSKCKKIQPFPFNLNPKDFSNYLSSAVTKKNLIETTFNDLNDCRLINKKYSRQYICRYGFITTSDRLGEKICRLSYVTYYKSSGSFVVQNSYDKNDCRWKS